VPAPGKPAEQPAAPPLSIPAELCLYESSVDLGECARSARSRCLVGASLGVCGFAGVLAGSAATATPAMQAVLCAGAVAYAYKNSIMATRSIAGLAVTHVERIVALPTAGAGGGAAAEGPPEEAAVEERLAATPEVQIKVRTANLDLWMKLEEPVSTWDGGRYSGFMSDDRAVVGNFFEEQRRLLYLEEVGAEGAPSSMDPALLRAVAASTKVVAERQLDLRSDVDSLLRLPPQGVKLAESLFFPVVKQGQQPQSGGAAARRGTPAQEITALGTQSLFSGVIFLMAGALYIGRDIAQDPNNPGKKDPTVGDFIARVRGTGSTSASSPPAQG